MQDELGMHPAKESELTPPRVAASVVRRKVVTMLTSLGIPTHTPCLKLEVTSDEGTAFVMNSEDVLKVFEKFGEVRSLRVLGTRVLVLFKH